MDRLVLAEDDIEDVGLILPEDDFIEEPVIEPTSVEQPKEEVVNNAYAGLLQDLLKKQWEVVNTVDSIIATMEPDEFAAHKEDLKAILLKIVEATTVTIGMATKAIGVIDPSQEELMAQGVEQAEEVVGNDIPAPEGVTFDLSDGTGEPIEVTVKDGEIIEEEKEQLNEGTWDTIQKVSFEDEPYYKRMWEEEALYQLGSIFDDDIENKFDAEDIAFVEDLSKEDIENICKKVYDRISDMSGIWDDINETVCDTVWDVLFDTINAYKEVQPAELSIGNKEGE